VQDAVPAPPFRCSERRAGWEAGAGIGHEDSSHDQTESEAGKQGWTPGASPAMLQNAAHTNGRHDIQRASSDEVADLDPTEVAKAQQAQGMAA
jgi:large exoprotein involved in heme utilization and adhesion